MDTWTDPQVSAQMWNLFSADPVYSCLIYGISV